MIRRVVMLTLAAAAAASGAFAQPTRSIVTEAPSHRRMAEVRGVGADGGGNSIWIAEGGGAARRVLEGREDPLPAHNLQGFSQPLFSNDGRVLYFNSEAWTTSAALHQLDAVSGREAFLVDGGLIGVVAGGRFDGYLVVLRHRYHPAPAFGSYEAATLVSPNGRVLTVISTADEPVPTVVAWLQRRGGHLRQPPGHD